MTEFPLSRRKKWTLKSEPVIPDQTYLVFEKDPETGLVPYEYSEPLTLLPKSAANFELLMAGRSPFIIVPEGKDPSPKTRELAYTLLHNLDTADAWKDLLTEKEKIGVDVYVISHHSERYVLKSVDVGYGGLGGTLYLQPLGAPLGTRVKVPMNKVIMHDAEGNPHLTLLPVVFYRK